MRLRHIILPALAAGALWAAAGLFAPRDGGADAARLVEAAAPQAPVPRLIPETSPAATPSLKAAFEATPGEPSFDFDSETAAQDPEVAGHLAAIEPGAGQPPAKTLARTLQDGIGNLLDTGSAMIAQSRKTLAVGRGDTLMDLLVKNDVPRGEAYEAIEALAKVYDPRKLRPAHEITVFFHETPDLSDPQFSGLEIQKDVVSSVHVSRAQDGHYTVGQTDKHVRMETRGFRGKIDNSLYVSAKTAGLSDGVLLDMIRLYSWSVDFQREIKQGDSFEVMYQEAVTEDGEVVPGRSEIVYARLTLSGQDYPLYRFEDSQGDADYFDAEGRSTRKTLLRTPIDGARLSSGFGMRRHPVIGYNKMHKGLDFAAPTGTPIYAAGDGRITVRGRRGGYGNYIRIRHNNGFDTAYAHMKGFKSGLSVGSRVKQGQVIGYVGTTGQSTGPHLHYEVLQNGTQVNPARLKLPTGKALAGADLRRFKTVVAETDRAFARIGKPVSVAGLDVNR